MNTADILRENPNVQIVYEGVKKKGEKTLYDKDGNPVPAIVFGVEKKLSKEDLKKGKIPVLPKKLGEKPTDVIEVGKIKALKAEPQQGKWRPIKAGISVGHCDITAGTLGAVVVPVGDLEKLSASKSNIFSRFWKWLMNLLFDDDPEQTPDPEYPPGDDDIPSGNYLIVSNAHVLNNENQGCKGDPIIQPGDYDGGILPDDAIAEVYEAVPLSIKGTNYVDVALGRVYGDIECKLGQYGGLPIKSPLLDARVGTKVCKTGRTTFYTEGKITGTNAASRIEYDCGNLIFEKQIVIESANPYPFSQGGDSGSLIMDMDGRPVALLFAGSDVITLANPIGLVMDSLKTKFTFG